MRVLLGKYFAGMRDCRITPACAGTTFLDPVAAANIRDHPRVCGYYEKAYITITATVGSPPRVRVLLSHKSAFVVISRITPACAGTTYPGLRLKRRWEDHPRVCGYYPIHLAVYMDVAGSPPRVRVLLSFLRDLMVCRGITPACAGTTR